MKEHISILKLAAANSFYKILAVMGLTLILEFILFAISALRQPGSGLETVFTGSGIPAGAAVGTAVIFTMLYKPLSGEKNSRPLTTLQRLGIKNTAAAFWIALYNFIVFVIFWALQIFAVLLMSKVFLNITGAQDQAQIIFMACWRVGFIHSLLPLSDRIRLISTLLDIILLSVSLLLPVFSGEFFLSEDVFLSGSAARSYLPIMSLLMVLESWCVNAGDVLTIILNIGFDCLLISFWIAQVALSCRMKDEPGKGALKRLEKKEAKALKKKGVLL